MLAMHPHLGAIDEIAPADPAALEVLAAMDSKSDAQPFAHAIRSFYLTNPIARASAVMAECARRAAGNHAIAAE
jgi:NADH-quinone oxidoreductase subunit G